MTTPPTKSLALELADKHGKWTSADCMDAAAELRRLAAIEQELAALKEALRGLEPVAWLHVMDNTEGCEENEPWSKLDFTDENPFGVPGEDYSEEYPVSSTPLYTLPPNLKDSHEYPISAI